MARKIKVASVSFSYTEDEEGQSQAGVLKQLAQNADYLQGMGMDLIVFSECVEACGQTMDQAESLDDFGPLLNFYSELARKEDSIIAGSSKINCDGKVYNSIVYFDPDGKVLGRYDKSNLTMGELEVGISPGLGAGIVETPAGRLAGAICFDLNFTELLDEMIPLKPDIIIFPSMYHGGLMQAQWAYQCRAFFVSSLYSEGGGILDPFGRPVKLADNYNRYAMAEINLDRAIVHLDYNRDKFPDIIRKYQGKIILDVPPNIGSALIYSDCEELSAMDVVNEFELELLDDYFARARAANSKKR
ncbi:MAG: carbon-nitrogen hydrolase family protein [Lentisphaeria bacterium]|nr:carbon-nitrogen hydrolase family protein [Lentisphaeria bacterium]NQZ69449.1 carbon-nitrogen hydrolase family protein [Lentisphaeria bacterium]